MTDFTSYDKYQLEGLLMMLLNDTTAEVTEDNDGEIKTVVSPVFTTGIGFDTESTTIYTDDTHKTVKDCFCYTYQVAIGTEHYAIYRTLDQFLDFLHILSDVVSYKNIDCESPAKVYIWVANLAHEWAFIKYRLMNEFNCTKIFAQTERDVLFVEFGDIQFRECIGLFGHSLSNIANNWTKTQKLKGDLDYNLIRTSYTPLNDTEKQYCINDVIILTEMHEAVAKAYLQDNGALRLPYTSSGFVRMKLKESIRNYEPLTDERLARSHCFKKPPKDNIGYIKRQNKRIFVSPEQWLLCREYGYSGGLCGSNIEKVGKDLTNVKCADLTSDYPAQMLHNKYPSGWLKECKLREYTRIKNSKKPYFIMAKVDFESKTNHATFSEHKILNNKSEQFIERFGAVKEKIVYNGKILKAKNCIVIMNDIDISAYTMIYDLKITVLKVWAFDRYSKLPEWLTNCVKTDYVQKATLKHNGDTKSIAYFDAKRNINTYYGVLATRDHDLHDSFDIDSGLIVNSKTKTTKQMFAETWLNPYWAFWCTSYARRILMYFISKYPDNIIQYDTDSLYYDGNSELESELLRYNAEQIKMNERIFKGAENIDLLLDLGCWDFDETYERFLAMGAKKYVKQIGDKIETVIAGLPKTSIPSEIKAKNIRTPLSHYNVVKKYLLTDNKNIIIEHMFAHKFASEYNDKPYEYKANITDYLDNTAEQICGCYHAIKPIDFTLSMGIDYLQHVLNIDKKPLI